MAMNLEFDSQESRVLAGKAAGQNLFAFILIFGSLEPYMVTGSLSEIAETHRRFWYRVDAEWFEVDVLEPGLVRIRAAGPFERWSSPLRRFIERTDKAIAWLAK